MTSSDNREWRAGALALALLVVGAVVGLIVRGPDVNRSVEQLAVTTVLPERRALPAFTLTDHDGLPYDVARLNGNWDLVFFGFSICGAICPATLLILSSVTAVTGADAQLAKIASAVGATYSVPDADGDYMVGHTASVLLVDPRGRYAGVITRPDDPELIAADLRRLAGS